MRPGRRPLTGLTAGLTKQQIVEAIIHLIP
jgi:hypothetical protein